MASTKDMTEGTEIVVNAGDYEGWYGKVVDTTVTPDRKIELLLTSPSDESDQVHVHLLPRHLDIVGAAARTPLVADTHESLPILDPMDPILDVFRPDPSILDRYIDRDMGGINGLDALLKLRNLRDSNGYSPNVALSGDTQSGKSMVIRALAVAAAKADGLPKPYPVFTISGSAGVTNYDLFGETAAVIIKGKETLVRMEGLVSIFARVEGAFLNLEEWNAVPPQQAIALHSLLDDNREFVNTHKPVPDGHGGFMPEKVKMNPKNWILSSVNIGYKGTQAMAEASTNRFTWVEWEYDENVEAALIPEPIIRRMAEVLRSGYERRLLSIPCGTSALVRFRQQAVAISPAFATASLLSMYTKSDRSVIEHLMSEEDDLLRSILTAEFR